MQQSQVPSLGPLMLDIEGTELTPDETSILKHPLVGGLILFSRNYKTPEQLTGLIRSIRAVSPNIIIAVDHEGGRVQRFRKGFSQIPPMSALGKIFNQDLSLARNLARDWGWLMAAELRAFDIDLSFAPVLDRDYGNSAVIGDRAFSSDLGSIVELAKHFCLGMNEAGMAATGKHFPGHGFVSVDSHVGIPIDQRSLNEIEENDLPVFEALVQEGLEGIMPAHIIFEQVDEHPAGFSRYWLQEVLRKKLSFKGVIFSDDLDMAGASVAGDFAQRADSAIDAGCDMILVCNNPAGARAVLKHIESRSDVTQTNHLVKVKGKAFPHSSMESLMSDPKWQRVSKTTVLENLQIQESK